MNLTKALLRCGTVAGPAFMGTALVEGARRADYQPLRHPISALALGPGGKVQTNNFRVGGGLFLLGAAGLWRVGDRTAAATTAVTGGALLLSSVFATDPVSGYPPGTADAPAPATRAGTIHDLTSIPIFLGLPLAQLTEALRDARRQPAWAVYSATSAAVMAAGFLGSSAAFSQVERWVPYGGAFQRVAAASGLGWLTALSLRAAAVSRGR